MLEILGDTLDVGAVIANAYRLERVVGEGGMGVVWSARELASGRAVALKFLRAAHESDPKAQQRFLREARAVMAVSHPHVAKVEAVLETAAGVPFLVMELLVGEPLRALLERRGMLTAIETAQLLLPVCDAVAAAHAMGIVHRDLKPENVFLVGPSAQVRVLDFGIAKQLPRGDDASMGPSLTSTGAVLGTPLYMAPEQIFGDQDIDGRADVWSLGIMLYECLAGRRPTDGDGFGPIIKLITTGPLLPLASARVGLPRSLTELVDRMLARPREQRPSLGEVRALLTSIAQGVEASGPSPYASTVDRFHRPMAGYGGSTTGGLAQGGSFAPPPLTRPPPSSSSALLGVGIAGAVVFGVAAVGGGVLFLRSRDAGPTVATDAGAVGDGSLAPFIETAHLIQEAQAAQNRHDGATCMAKLDALDKAPNGRPSGHPSTDPGSGYAGMRGICMMLVGRCDEGKRLYRTWLVPFVAPDAGIDVDQSTNTVVSQYCKKR